MDFSKTLWVFQCLYLIQVASLETKTTRHIQAGSNVRLNCIAGENCTWLKEGGTNTTIFSNGERISPDPEYGRFYLHNDATNCSLGINSASIDDSGTYICKSDQLTLTHAIKVEEPPQLIIYVNDQKFINKNVWHVYVKLGDELKVTCVANVSDANIVTCLEFPLSHSSHADHVMCESNGTRLSTTETLQVNHKDGAIICTGWENDRLVNTHKLALHVQYIPECQIHLIKDVIDCVCEANPPTQYYLVKVNGEGKSNTTSYQLTVTSSTVNISCTAVNSIGVNSPQEILYKPPEFDDPYATVFWIITCIIVISVTIVILTQAVVICRKESERNTDKELRRNTEFNRKPYSSRDDSQTVLLTDSSEDRL